MSRDHSQDKFNKSVDSFRASLEALGQIIQPEEVHPPKPSRWQKVGSIVMHGLREAGEFINEVIYPQNQTEVDLSQLPEDQLHKEAKNGGLIVHISRSWHDR